MSEKKLETVSQSDRWVSIIMVTVVALTMAVLIRHAYGYYVDINSLEEKRQQLVRLSKLQGEISYYDEVLTMSARMAASTGDPYWEARYKQYVPRLEAVINEASTYTQQMMNTQGVELTDEANKALIALEDSAFNLVRQNKKEEALSLLLSEAYQDYKKTYSQGLEEFNTYLQKVLINQINDERQEALFSFTTSLIIFLFLIAAWLSGYFMYRRWNKRLLESSKKLTLELEERQKAELSLLDHKENLETLVEERTIELTESQKELEEVNKKLVFTQHAVDKGSDMVYWLELDATIFYVNNPAILRVGYSFDELVGNKISMIDPEFPKEKWMGLVEMLSAGEIMTFESQHQAKNGERYPIEITARMIEHDGDKRIISNVRDITERKEAEASLKKAKKETEKASKKLKSQLEQLKATNKELHKLKFSLDNTNNLVWWVDPKDGSILYMNLHAKERNGYSLEDYPKLKVFDFDPVFNEEMWPDFGKAMEENGQMTFETKNETINGEVYPIEVSAKFLTYEGNDFLIAVARDISERVKAEESLKKAKEETEKAFEQLKGAQAQLVQSEKMSSVGQLAAGIAHEINNPVNFTRNSSIALERDVQDVLDLVKQYQQFIYDKALSLEELKAFEEEIDVKELLEAISIGVGDIKEGTSRTSKIVKGLRAFSREDTEEKEWADIHEGIEATLNVAKNRLKNGIEVHKHFDSSIDKALCFPGQLNQVFLNLIVNAADALEEKGEINITTEKSDDKITISFQDNGPGIPESVKSKIFDPFYTTKKLGEGTGLGLSISREIIKKHDGELEVSSAKGKGTEFRITLPAE